MPHVTERSLAELRRLLAARETTAVAIAEAHLARIAAADDGLHAFVTRTADAALGAAQAADRALARGDAPPLAGVPVAVKDLFAVRDVPRHNGSAAFADVPASQTDATAVARLRAAGAVVLGTTHMHELAFGPTGVNPFLGTPRNPWHEGRVPGGSSSGSGVAVAAGLVPAALGTDTGGSIRVPAAFCGVSGLKPTYGRVSRAGVTPLAWSLDHVGPLARTVEDLALLLQVLAGHDPADVRSAAVPVPDYVGGLGGDLRGTRIGVPRGFALAVVDAEVVHRFEEALAVLHEAGAAIVDVTLPMLEHAAAALGATILAEATAALRPLLGARLDAVSLEVRAYLELGKVVSAESYLAAQRVRTRLYDEFRDRFRRLDLVALPTTALPAPPLESLQVRLGGVQVGTVEAISRLTGPFNLTGLPALSVPCGFSADGLPIGLQLVGPPFGERELLAAGDAFQRLTDWHRRRPAAG
jgi:aspartyl-tRNA(Asn)/glutamyl-tRNA(Gln) amidotransferase subunit A